MTYAYYRCSCASIAADTKCYVGQVMGIHKSTDTVTVVDYEALANRPLHEEPGLYVEAMNKEAKRIRPSWDQYFLAMASVVAQRATCDRKHVGAIIVDERHRIVSTGYNGSAKGMPHCDDVGHLLKEVDGRESCIRTLHAESNALDDAGRRADKGTIYVTVIPCYGCALRIVNAGIQRVIWDEFYSSQNTKLVIEFFKSAGVDYKGADSE